MSNTIVIQKYWYKNGKFLTIKGSGADDRKVSGNAKYFLTLENKNGKSILGGNRNIRMKVGEKLSVVRKSTKDTRDYGYRLMTYSDSDILRFGNVIQANKPGRTSLIIEPNAYGDRIRLNITVTK